MRRSLVLTLGTLLLAGWVVAAPQAPKKQGPLLCTLTNTKIEKCCCEPRGNKLYCPLAKKTVDTCCCKRVEAQKKRKT